MKKMGRELAKSTILNHNAALQMVFKQAIENQRMLPIQVPVLSNKGFKVHDEPPLHLMNIIV
jgi:hypothetical protein